MNDAHRQPTQPPPILPGYAQGPPMMQPPPRTGGGSAMWLVIGLSVVTVLVIAGAVVAIVLVSNANRMRQLPPRVESTEKKFAEATASLTQTPEDARREASAHPHYADIHLRVTHLATSMRRQDATGYGMCYDAKRWLEESLRLGLMPRVTAADERRMVRDFETGLAQAVRSYDGGLAWDTFRIVRITDLNDPNEVRAIVRAINDLGYHVKVCLWLRRSDDTWRVYDMEDLDTGLRGTTTTAVAMADALSNADTSWLDGYQTLSHALVQIASDDIGGAQRSIAAVANMKFPRQLESFRQIVLLNQAMVTYDQPGADAALAALYGAADTPPVVHYLAATYHNQWERHQQALDAAMTYISLLGDDPDVLLEVGTAHLGLGNRAAAREAFRSGLEGQPNNVDCLLGLAQSVDAAQLSELGEHLANMDDQPVAFDILVSNLVEMETLPALRALADAHEKDFPDDGNLGYYRSEALQLENNHEAAIPHLEKALPHAPPDEKEAYINSLQHCLVQVGRFKDAYHADEDLARSFDIVAGELLAIDNVDWLRELIELHERDHADDLWIPYYRGELASREGSFAGAAEAFRDGLARAKDDEDARMIYTEMLVDALRHDNQLGEAYRMAATIEEGVIDLVWSCIFEENAAQLGEILDLHAAAQPDDAALPVWRAYVPFWKEAYAEVVDALAPKFESLMQTEHYATAEFLMIRSLVRLKRFDEALDIAEGSTARDGDPYLEVLVHGLAGDVENAAKAYKGCLELGYDLDVFVDDPDLSDHLMNSELRSALERAEVE